jgi:hypothetical protein
MAYAGGLTTTTSRPDSHLSGPSHLTGAHSAHCGGGGGGRRVQVRQQAVDIVCGVAGSDDGPNRVRNVRFARALANATALAPTLDRSALYGV